MKTAIYPGSFDPVTYGHLDIIERSAALFDRLVIGVLVNSTKSPMFSMEERVEMIRQETAHLPNVEVRCFSGLTVDFARENGAGFMVRGLRAVTDFEYELQLSHTNRQIAPDLDTVFLTTGMNYGYISSSVTKEIASLGGDITKFVPPAVAKRIKEKLADGGKKK
ncbi:MAG: pantetheine-phosphate adenylyltransferase [Eubacteriales bacterium]|nr:pantetheine-phosphate adenylyltransferase [Eubacteriales bacterium]